VVRVDSNRWVFFAIDCPHSEVGCEVVTCTSCTNGASRRDFNPILIRSFSSGFGSLVTEESMMMEDIIQTMSLAYEAFIVGNVDGRMM